MLSLSSIMLEAESALPMLAKQGEWFDTMQQCILMRPNRMVHKGADPVAAEFAHVIRLQKELESAMRSFVNLGV